MKKTMLSAALVAMLGLGSMYAYQNYSSQPEMSDAVVANLEALAGGEGLGTRYKCYSSTVYEEGASVIICSTCEEVYNKTDALFCFHDWCYRE